MADPGRWGWGRKLNSGCNIMLATVKFPVPSALLIPPFVRSCCESGEETGLFLERKERKNTSCLHHSGHPVTTAVIDTTAGQKLANGKAEKTAGKDGNCGSWPYCQRQPQTKRWKNGRREERH